MHLRRPNGTARCIRTHISLWEGPPKAVFQPGDCSRGKKTRKGDGRGKGEKKGTKTRPHRPIESRRALSIGKKTNQKGRALIVGGKVRNHVNVKGGKGFLQKGDAKILAEDQKLPADATTDSSKTS